MDIVSKSAIELTTLALDGLAARHKVISSNIANAETPGFKRSDVNFNDQLNAIMNKDNAIQKAKEDYSMSLMYFPKSLASAGQITMAENFSETNNIPSAGYEDFKPEIALTNDPVTNSSGNNINVEQEMAQLAQNGMKYNALSVLQEKMFRGMSEVIKGGGM